MGMPWFKFFGPEYLTDTKISLLPLEAQAILIRIFCVCSCNDFVPNCIKTVSNLIGVERRKLAKYWPVLMQFFTESDQGLYSKRLKSESDEYKKTVEKNRNNGQKGGRPKNPVVSENENPVGLPEQKPKPNRKEEEEKRREVLNEDNLKIIFNTHTQSIADAANVSEAGKAVSKQNDFPQQFQSVVDHWNTVCGAKGLPKVQKLDVKRKAAMKARLAESGWLDDFKAACDFIANREDASFYRGSGEKSWTANLDFLLRPGKAGELSERARTPPAHKASPSRASPTQSRTASADRALAEQMAKKEWAKLQPAHPKQADV
jgi:uncharacterized protein YdaU (DUF1376 family)